MYKKDFTLKSLINGRRLSVGLLTICFVMFSGLLFASHAQNVKLTLKLNNETMSSAIQKIAKQSNLDFFYSQQQLSRVEKKVSINYSNAELSEILTDILSDTDFTYKFEENGVVIVPRPTAPISALQQPAKREIKGKVVESGTKKPLAGATVIVVGTSNGAITDEGGNFIVAVLPSNKQLEISYTGYVPQVITIGESTNLTVEMMIAAVQVDDVVVTGVFTRKQNTYSGAVSTIKAADLAKTGNINLIQALGSLDPSFNILTNNEMGSNPNAMPDIQMRGAASFSDMKNSYSTSPNQPLFIVDGFEQSLQKVMDMDMNRVSSVTLLKDATAKAIYGSKGANGVVVIETFAPAKGALTVSYKGDLNIQTPILRDYDRTNAAEKLELERIVGMFSSNNPVTQLALDKKYQELYQGVLSGVNSDWLAQPVQVGVGHKHSLNIEGGDDRFRYNVNLAYNNIAGGMKGSNRKTFEGGVNLQYQYKSLLFKEQLSITNNNGVESPYGNFSDYTKMNPYWKMYDENGNVLETLGQYDISNNQGEHDIYNPLINPNSNYKNENQYLDITNNFYIEWSPVKDLKLVGRLGITKRSNSNDLFYPSNYTTIDFNSVYNFRAVSPDAADDAYNKRGLYRRSIGDTFSLSSDITVNYSKQIDKHLFFANAQYNISESKTELQNFEGQGFADNSTSITQARIYRENKSPYGTDNKTRELGAILSVNYSFDSKYLFDANYRANASSLFGANNSWGHFWSVGAGWNVHKEKFMDKANWLDNLKIRASFGYTGSQNFSSYQALATYSYFNDMIYDNIYGAYLMAMSNPDLKWQQTEDQNIGFDLTFLKKFDVTFDYYVKNTTNLLTPITAVPSIGFDTFIQNLGKSQNKGIEAKVNYRILSDTKRDVFLSVFGNIAHNKNKLVEINDALSSMNSEVNKEQSSSSSDHEKNQSLTKPRVLYAEGVSLSTIWGVRSLGIDPYNGNEIFLKKDGTRTYTWDADDQVALGDAMPKIQGTFGLNFDYKGISLNAIFAYQLGGQYYNQTLVDNVENADLQYNVDRRVFTQRWNPETPGVAAKYSKLTKTAYFTRPTSRFVQDYNELKLSSLNVGYDFRNCEFMTKSKVIERLKVSLAMNDLFRLSTVKTERGILYPYTQSFIFSVQATF